MSGFNTKQKAVAIVELFQNALVYTTVLRNVDNLVKDKEHAIVILIMSTTIAASVVFVIQIKVARFVNAQVNVRGTSYIESLYKLIMFILDCTNNILVQLTSSLAATLAIAVFASADSVLWGFTGAFAALTLLWMLKQTLVG